MIWSITIAPDEVENFKYEQQIERVGGDKFHPNTFFLKGCLKI